ncbi:hypothetical protein HYS50_00620 [Candidatus Woesearchaeota archaeon]|nr:hypothetical protein [Candidatus Woesearchaeota archaeon]
MPSASERHYPVVSDEVIRRLDEDLRGLIESAAHHPAPELKREIITLDTQYIAKRDELLGLYESGKITLDAFFEKFKTEAAPFFERSQRLYGRLRDINSLMREHFPCVRRTSGSL